MLSLALSLAVAGLAVGCGAPARAPLQHVVLVKLLYASDAEALLADARRRLSAIPSVSELYVGKPLAIGRTGVDLDFDAVVIVAFADRQAYEAYLQHPEHMAFVEAWQPRWEWIRVHDSFEWTGPEPAPPPAAAEPAD